MPRAKEPTGKPIGKKTAAAAKSSRTTAAKATAKTAAKTVTPAKKPAEPRKRAARVASPAAEAMAALETPGALAAARLGIVEARDSRPSEQSGKYVYCIIQATEPLRFGRIGIGSEPADVHTVSYKDIAAVV